MNKQTLRKLMNKSFIWGKNDGWQSNFEEWFENEYEELKKKESITQFNRIILQ